jgi:hypothetical protein
VQLGDLIRKISDEFLVHNIIACYYSVLKLLSSCLLFQKLKIGYKTILPFAFHGNEMWLINLREEYNIRVFENKGLRKYLDLRRLK